MMLENTKVIILCGGKGSRLGKLTKNLPKPLVKLGKHSILEYMELSINETVDD